MSVFFFEYILQRKNRSQLQSTTSFKLALR